jgi:hypothetical protein
MLDRLGRGFHVRFSSGRCIAQNKVLILRGLRGKTRGIGQKGSMRKDAVHV